LRAALTPLTKQPIGAVAVADEPLPEIDAREKMRLYKREYARKWRRENPEKRREAKRRAYRKNPQRHIDGVRRWKIRYPEKVRAQKRKPSDREWSLKKKYGLTLDAWDALFNAQGRVCAACGTDKPGTKNGWHTDHCHETKVVRGILCLHCNVGIGKSKDNIDTMRKWIAYLERTDARTRDRSPRASRPALAQEGAQTAQLRL
jgi:hypothetical protein